MDKLGKMAVFARVVELGTFAAAAKDQNLSPAIVGRHVADLETMLGIRLINRTTRSREITEAGQRYYAGCKAALDQISALEQDISGKQGSSVSGIIRLSAPEGLGAPILLDIIEEFQVRYPEILFDLVLDNDRTDFVSDQVDLAVRLAISLEDSSLIISKLSETQLKLFAAPSYLAKHGQPDTIAELDAHACVAMGGSRFGDSWPIVTETGIRKLRQDWRLVINQTQAYRDALARGLGVGLLPDIMARNMIASGQLVPLELDVEFPLVGIFAVYPDRTFQSKRVSMFLAHLRMSLKNVEF